LRFFRYAFRFSTGIACFRISGDDKILVRLPEEKKRKVASLFDVWKEYIISNEEKKNIYIYSIYNAISFVILYVSAYCSDAYQRMRERERERERVQNAMYHLSSRHSETSSDSIGDRFSPFILSLGWRSYTNELQ